MPRIRARLHPRPAHRLPLSVAIAGLALAFSLGQIILPAHTTFAAPPGAPPAHAPRYVPDELLIAFQPDASPVEVRAILRDLGAERIRNFKRTPGGRHRVSKAVPDAVARYRGHRAIRYIEPNYLLEVDRTPNDLSFPLQWALRNTGQSNGTLGADVHAEAAWDQTTGSSSIIVAIVDSGMDLTHPDLAANLYTNPDEVPGNGLDDDGNGLADDVHGWDFQNFDSDPNDNLRHGTHVAGIIGAVGNNAVGVAGVAWQVRLLPVKFLGANGTGSTADAIDCIDYAVERGAAVINASWGGDDASEALRISILAAGHAGVLFVAAAGNNGLNIDEFPHYPSNFEIPSIISVGATNRTDQRAAYSNFGDEMVDLFAPGSQILSTVPGAAYAEQTGTSMAAPHVSGAIALLKARFPTMPAESIKRVVLGSSDRVPALAGLSVTGGRLNLSRMMEGIDSIPPGPVSNLAFLLASSDRVTVGWTASGDDGFAGTAAIYDLRVSSETITEQSFGAATRIPVLAAPKPSGGAEQAIARGLTPSSDYYLALKILDEYGNASAMSNVLAVRTTAPPVVAAVPTALEATLLTGARTTLPLTIRNDGEGALDFTAKPVGPGGGAPPPWLSVTPGAGSAPSGGGVSVTVGLNAAGRAGGDYLGFIRLESNDPARAILDVPVTMRVTSAPDIDISPTAVVFGPVMIGVQEDQGLLVTNMGFAPLRVAEVTIDNPEFAADTTGFSLGPGESQEILVSVTPARSGSILGTLGIRSDDPDESHLTIPLGAVGIVPPTASVSPESLGSSLQTGQVDTRTFTLTNSGGGALSWGVRASAIGAAPLEASSLQAADLSDVRILFHGRGGASPGAWGDFIGSLTSRGALLDVNAAPVSADVLDHTDIFWVVDAASSLDAVECEVLADWVRRGGSLLLESEAIDALPGFNEILGALDVSIRFDEAVGFPGLTTRLRPHEITRGAAQANLASASPRLTLDPNTAAVVLEDGRGAPAVASAFVERGRVLAVSGSLLADGSATYYDNRRLASQSMDWLGGAAWLTATPPYGTTMPGKSATITVRFDADRLVGAEYSAAVVVRSNDAAHPVIPVPVEFHVTSAPDIALGATALDLGSVFVGEVGRDSVTVDNVGVLPLHVSSVTVSEAQFRLGLDAFTIAPGERRVVTVDYSPTTVAPASGTIRLTSDDPDEPELLIALSGLGTPPPDADLDPAGVDAALASGATAIQTLTLFNRSGSDLEFIVRFEEGPAPGAVLEPVIERTLQASGVGASWSEHREAARAAHPVVEPMLPGAFVPASVDTLPLVLIDPRGDGGVADALVLRASARGGALLVELKTATVIEGRNFGGYLSLDIDQNPNTGRPPTTGIAHQDIGVEFEVGLFSLLGHRVDLFDGRTGYYLQSFAAEADSHSIRFAIPLSWLGGDEGRMDVTGVIGNHDAATDWLPQRGHGTIGGSWLLPVPPLGTLAAGDSMAIQLRLDAGDLKGGGYAGTIIVETNDPDEAYLTRPASLTVTDASLLSFPFTRLDLGEVYIGYTSEGEWIIGNRGTAQLTVTSITSGLADFTVDPSSCVIPPGGTQAIHVTFRPVEVGPRATVLRVTWDGGDPVECHLTGRAIAPPVIVVGPQTIATTVMLGEKASTPVTVANRGGWTLSYAAEAMNGAPVVRVHETLDIPRDAEDPRTGSVRALGTGGPDRFGYRWVDSRQPGGPVFHWRDIQSAGKVIPIRNLDQNSGPLPIGFPFPFYGRVFTTFNVCTHGWISFTDTTVQYLNQPLPAGAGSPGNLLAAFWDDLNFGQVERATYHNDGTRLIVQFTSVPRRQRGGPLTFQVILYPSGAVVYQYLLMGAPITSGTIGIQNQRGDDGLLVSFNDTYLSDGLAIRFSAAPAWLSVAPQFGTAEAGDSTTLSVTTDAKGLFAGTYQGTVRISSTDPAREEILIPIAMRAAGIPELAVSPTTLRFDTLLVGEVSEESLVVTNPGTDWLEVTSITTGRPDLTASPAALSLAPLQSATVSIRFAPATSGDRSASLVLTSNAASGLVTVPVTAFARLAMRGLAADIIPSTIQRGSRGQHVRAHVLVPGDLDAGRLVLADVRLLPSVPADLGATRLRDLDGDGRLDLDLAFDRIAVERVLPEGNRVPVTIEGEFQGQARFGARDTVRVTGKRIAAPGVDLVDGAPPVSSAIHPNVPNPFHPVTAIPFDLAEPSAVTLRIFGADGRLVRTLVAASLPAGRYAARWDGRTEGGAPAASGFYFARLDLAGASPFRDACRMLLLR